MTTKNFIGEKYGRLLVTGRLGLYAQCLCDCGATCTPRMDKLREGKTKSCGCLAAEQAERLRKPKVPKPPRAKRTPDENRLVAIHSAMMQRCTNPNNAEWKRYGGRGIRVCPEWTDKSAFLAWALPMYRRGLYLERLDNDGPYSPDNCAFRTAKAQARNRSNTLWVDHPDGRKPLPKVAAYLGLNYHTAYKLYWKLVREGRTPAINHFRHATGKWG